MADALKQLRTFVLCLIALLGVLILAGWRSWGAIETAAAVTVPLAAWIGGKAWASAMDTVKHIRGGDS